MTSVHTPYPSNPKQNIDIIFAWIINKHVALWNKMENGKELDPVYRILDSLNLKTYSVFVHI